MLDDIFFKWTRNPLFRQVLTSLSCYLSIMIAATCYYWMAPYSIWLIKGNHELQMTTSEFAWLTSIIEVGAIIGCIPSAYIADRWGRKSLILSSGPIYLAIWLLTAFTKNIIVFYIARILQGFLLAIADCVCSVYVAETSHPKRRVSR
ncbi:uncharacterized protein isoform X2 [Rhodnius prolixus]|uniref:uncharacterized protein isoform X2 n=1 Tax=Rhodnius prolixus TaxID=13249 RepID=UPI003D18F2D7